MIQSMTGFGRAELSDLPEEKRGTGQKKLTVEIKSVNHRYADFTIKMPHRFNRYETQIRGILKEYIRRGKVDVYISYRNEEKAEVSVKYNRDIAREYMKFFRDIQEEFGEEGGKSGGMKMKLTPALLGQFPEVFSLEEAVEEDEEELFAVLTLVLREALKRFSDAREAEGKNLAEDLLGKLRQMEQLVDRVEALSPEIVEAYKQKLADKVREFLERGDLEEGRIAAEVTIFADKICVDEEMVRLRSHIDQTRSILENGGDVGRKLDFIIQEMNREANTTLSKAGTAEITDIGIELKTLIEKMREQVQNLE